MSQDLTLAQMVAKIRDLVARCEMYRRQLEAACAHNDWLRAQLNNRPSRADYETLAAELTKVRADLEAAQTRNRALSRTL